MNEKQQEYLRKAKEHALSKGGECLSENFTRAHDKIEWKCSNPNHNSWFATYTKVVNGGRWCPQCANNKRSEDKKNLNILLLAKEYAKIKNGECLTNKYINITTKLEWKCNNPNHKPWFATYKSVCINHSWCSICKNEFLNKKKLIKNTINKQTLNEEKLRKAKEYALSKGGECLSNEYINSKKKLEWKCSNPNHKPWFALKKDSWCPQCAIDLMVAKKRLKNGLDLAKEHALSKGGVCLSNEYVNVSTKLEWKCENNHVFKMSFEKVTKRNQWCPKCSVFYYKEHKVRIIFEEIFKKPFDKKKPKWNITPKTNCLLELDGFNDDLKLAFEFQGIHHYKDNIFSKNNLKEVQYRDNIKFENCKRNKVTLLIIDDNEKTNSFNDLFEIIIKKLEENNIVYDKNYNIKDIENKYNAMINFQKKNLAIAKEYAKSKGGECLSTEYINSKEKLEWKCFNPNHKPWLASYLKIVNCGRWCPQCAIISMVNKQKNSDGLSIAKEYAKSKGGECLSNEYVNNRIKMEWKCANPNHQSWFANYKSVVLRGSWCPKCAIENRRKKL